MADTHVKVTFGANTEGVVAGVTATKSQIAALGPVLQQLNGAFQGMGEQVRASMFTAAGSAGHLAQTMHDLQGEIERNNINLEKAAAKANESASAYGTFKKAFEGIKGAFSMAGDIASAVGSVADFSQHMGKAAQETTQLSQHLHTTTGDVQAMQAMASVTGTKIDVFAGAMQGLDHTFAAAKAGGKQQNDALQAIGLSANGSYSRMQMLTAAMGKFSGMAEGPAKTALAMQLFGKAGADLLPVLSAGKDQMATFTKVLNDYGISNDAAVAKGNALAGAWATNTIAMQALNNILTDALAPIFTVIVDRVNLLIKAFIDSYTQGGIVAGLFSRVKIVVGEVGAAIDALAGVFGDLWDAVSEITHDIASAVTDLFGQKLPSDANASNVSLNVVKDTFVVLKNIVIVVIEIIRGHIEVLVGELRAFATVVHDVFTLQWGKIAGDWQAGVDTMATKVEATASRIAAAMHEAGTAMAAATHGDALLPTLAPHLNLPQGGSEGGEDANPKTSHGASARPKKKASAGLQDNLNLQLPPMPAVALPPTGEIRVFQEFADKGDAIIVKSQAKRTKAERDGEAQRAQIQSQAISATSSLWAQNISKLLTLQQGFGATLKNIYHGMVSMVSDALTKVLQNWISAELSKTAAVLFGTTTRTTAEEGAAAKSLVLSAATAIKQIAHAAGVAAANVWAAVAKMGPYGWIIAPALAAAALFGVIKLGQSIFSAEGGMGAVPYDNAPFLLHRNEMVLPASLASPLRAMLQGGGAANMNTPFAANDAGNGNAFHYHDHSGTMTPAQIVANRAAVAKAFRMAHREGHFAGMSITI